ncbi:MULTISPECIES: IDEAL domain-containing protein [Priestia]|uniref:IDEAL domain-containing protein n=1 Tax=Priestia TaxID=2800373 RepID=UPI0021F42885|nr:IDEAL domain-containing protein [Priestia megaterium]UYP07552.1 IDEAL domain-containing protein [Priestia megaterium]
MENNMSSEMIQVETSISDEMLVELFLSQVMRDFKKSKILEEIDQCLKSKDKETFLRLIDKLKSIS